MGHRLSAPPLDERGGRRPGGEDRPWRAPASPGSGGRCGGRCARGAARGSLRGGARVSRCRPRLPGGTRVARGLRAARPRGRRTAGGRGVGGVEAGALEDDADRVEDLAQRVLRAFGTGHQRVLAEALVLLESVFVALAGVDVGGHAESSGISRTGAASCGRGRFYDGSGPCVLQDTSKVTRPSAVSTRETGTSSGPRGSAPAASSSSGWITPTTFAAGGRRVRARS